MSGEDHRVRRLACGPIQMLPNGVAVAVPILPAWTFRDPEVGQVRCSSALLVRLGPRVHAYANLCRHLPIRLDLGDGVVAAPDGEHFFCHHHAARYRFEDGACAKGPCDGASLYKIDVELERGQVVLLLP